MAVLRMSAPGCSTPSSPRPFINSPPPKRSLMRSRPVRVCANSAAGRARTTCPVLRPSRAASPLLPRNIGPSRSTPRSSAATSAPNWWATSAVTPPPSRLRNGPRPRPRPPRRRPGSADDPSGAKSVRPCRPNGWRCRASAAWPTIWPTCPRPAPLVSTQVGRHSHRG